MERSYTNMKNAYISTFDEIGLDYRIVKADAGNIGGDVSEEFHIIADSGEDLLAISDSSEFAANVEVLEYENDPSELDGADSPDGKGKLQIKRGIEVGHIFQLGTKYSDSMNANVIGEDGRAVNMNMGCYGIGVTRSIAACIEQNHDERGIIFPRAIAPFELVIVPINYNKSSRVRELADQLYNECHQQNIDVLLDDRKERPGIMFADSELLGIPHRLVISDTHADNGKIEYKSRSHPDKDEIDFKDAISYIIDKYD